MKICAGRASSISEPRRCSRSSTSTSSRSSASSTATARPTRATCVTLASKSRGRRCSPRSSRSSTSSTWAIATPRATSTSTCSAKIATAGQNGQFRTPRHIIAMMVELVAPKPEDVICDPACGTCGFLVAAGEYLRKHHAALFQDDKLRRHFNERPVQRLRLRPHHAPHRLDEHDTARG